LQRLSRRSTIPPASPPARASSPHYQYRSATGISSSPRRGYGGNVTNYYALSAIKLKAACIERGVELSFRMLAATR